MLFQFGAYRLDIDLERTRDFYLSRDSVPTSRQCACPGCQNFDKAILRASEKVLSFLTSMGINPCQPSEAFGVEGVCNSENEYWYNGWYHVVGTLEASGTVDTQTSAEAINEKAYQPDENFDFRAWFLSESHGWIEPNFPQPSVEIEFSTHLPWVI